MRNGASRTRTGDLLGAIQALSQLSYSPTCGGKYVLADRAGAATGWGVKDTLSRG